MAYSVACARLMAIGLSCLVIRKSYQKLRTDLFFFQLEDEFFDSNENQMAALPCNAL